MNGANISTAIGLGVSGGDFFQTSMAVPAELRAETVAVAAGKAFSFGYAEHPELLRAAGAQVVEFDPLTGPLPEGTDAVLLPGGFPEQFTAELSANDVVRRQ